VDLAINEPALGGVVTLRVHPGDHITRVMARSGRLYEHVLLERIRALRLPGGYIDAGACTGTHAVWFARACPSTWVVAFEPSIDNLILLRENVVRLAPHVVMHQLALGAAPSRGRTVIEDPANRGMDRQAADPTGPQVVVPLDDVHLPGEDVALIKIDVQGMEIDVLRGASKILTRCHPAVVIECSLPGQLDEASQVLAAYGYAPPEGPYCASPTWVYLR
jgi:FkbM family methyltransferase